MLLAKTDPLILGNNPAGRAQDCENGAAPYSQAHFHVIRDGHGYTCTCEAVCSHGSAQGRVCHVGAAPRAVDEGGPAGKGDGVCEYGAYDRYHGANGALPFLAPGCIIG